ncbi:M42 family metallopeptidase [Sediminitomix flava]|uniref:Endoglucanase n=1 Tax=Sediminitomix flava TaxID=379075 RepID=A0A315ZH79_SEDFL|nr:M42 family metallopeptidase [Sediminitomix flava]PWJ44539.1 endoglucanase [Sediminitomix flava]
MEQLNFDLLKQISETPGAPGYEKPIRDFMISQVKDLCDEWYTDNIGNLITVKRGSNNPENKKVMLAAHIDEIGFMVKHIDDKGYIRFHTLGGFDPKTLTSLRVIVHGKKDLVGVMGSKPIHSMSPEERNKVMKSEEYYIDLGLPKEEVEKYVSVGNPITRKQEMIEVGNCINGKSLDNRICVYALLEVLKDLKGKEIPYDLYATFTVQEEVGLRGAHVAAHHINPDFGIAIDVTVGNDVPNIAPQDQVSALGEGCAIKIFDAGTICDYRMVEFLKQTAEKHDIQNQHEILTAGGTDTAGIQRMSEEGAIAGAISIPLRYLHQTTEMAHANDVITMVNLLVKSLEDIDKFDWSH